MTSQRRPSSGYGAPRPGERCPPERTVATARDSAASAAATTTTIAATCAYAPSPSERDGGECGHRGNQPRPIAFEPERPAEADVAEDEQPRAGAEPESDPVVQRVVGVRDRLLEPGRDGDDGKEDSVVPVPEPGHRELRSSFRRRVVKRTLDRFFVAK